MKKSSLLSIISIILISLSHFVIADIKLPTVIGAGMVLQRDMPVPIWGWADEGENVSFTFAGQTKKTTADANGKWMVKLDPLKANGNNSTLTIIGNNTIHLIEI